MATEWAVSPGYGTEACMTDHTTSTTIEAASSGWHFLNAVPLASRCHLAAPAASLAEHLPFAAAEQERTRPGTAGSGLANLGKQFLVHMGHCLGGVAGMGQKPPS